MTSNLSLGSRVLVEQVGDEVFAVLPDGGRVVRLSGVDAQTVLDVRDGKVLHPGEVEVSHLIDIGVLSRPHFSRRGFLKAGVVGASAGIAIVSLPSVAVASSEINLAGSHENLGEAYQFKILPPGPLPDGDPSTLTVEGVGDFDYSERYQEGWISWVGDPSDYLTYDQDQVYYGTFTWGGRSYRVRFGTSGD